GTREHREVAGDYEQDARKLLRRRLRELAVHRAGLRQFSGPRQERVMMYEVLNGLEQDYEIHERRSLPQLRSRLKHIRAFFALDRALAVTSNRLRDYIAQRQKQGAAPATINRELETVPRAFAIALESNTISIPLKVPSLPEHNARQGFFERNEFEAILKQLPDTDVADFCEWFWWTGMRPREIRSLGWDAFDRDTWTLRLH